MIHAVAMALLALSLNQSPNTARAGAKAKFPTRTEKPKPPPPEEPSHDKPTPAPQEDEAPRPHRPPLHEDSQSDSPEKREESKLAVIRRNMPQIENCFDRARSWSRTLQGEVSVEWELSSGGDVRKAELTGNSTGSTELGSCILQVVKTWTFPAPGTAYPSRLSHTFRFQSS